MGSGESLSRADGAGMTMAAPVGAVGVVIRCASSRSATLAVRIRPARRANESPYNCGISNTVARKLACRDGTRVMGPISLMQAT